MDVFGDGSDVVQYSQALIAKGRAPLASSPTADVIVEVLSCARYRKMFELREAFLFVGGSRFENAFKVR